MEEQEICFDDWEKQAQLITNNNTTIQSQQTNTQIININQQANSFQENVDPYDKHLRQIERLKRFTPEEFQNQFIKKQYQKEVKPFNALLKCQKDFIELAKNIGQKFRKIGRQSEEKTLPQNQIVTFFEQFTLYLYGNMEWQSLQIVKQKLKIIKKDKKQQENRVKKQKEKQQRLKRTKQETSKHQQQQIG